VVGIPPTVRETLGINDPATLPGREVVTVQYAYVVPEGFVGAEVLAPTTTLGTLPQMMGNSPDAQARPATAVVERYVLPGDDNVGCQITLAAKDASNIRPTFTQLLDLSGWGSAAEIRSLFVPLGAELTQVKEVALERGVVDTGTLRGRVALAPRSLYRYDFVAPDGLRVCLGVSVRAGKVYVLTATGTEAQWADGALRAKLQGAADSLRVLDKPIL